MMISHCTGADGLIEWAPWDKSAGVGLDFEVCFGIWIEDRNDFEGSRSLDAAMVKDSSFDVHSGEASRVSTRILL